MPASDGTSLPFAAMSFMTAIEGRPDLSWTSRRRTAEGAGGDEGGRVDTVDQSFALILRSGPKDRISKDEGDLMLRDALFERSSA
jgi:hypothetical protein